MTTHVMPDEDDEAFLDAMVSLEPALAS